MDAFTESILARARERQRLLHDCEPNPRSPLREQNVGTVSEPNLRDLKPEPSKEMRSEPDIPSISKKSPDGQQTKTLNIQRDDFNMEITLNSADNVRLEVEIQERSDDENYGLREESKNQLRRLGKLYAGGDEADISSPIHRAEAKFYQRIQEDMQGSKQSDSSRKGLSRLADLAQTINQWEDNMSHPARTVEPRVSPRKAVKAPAPPPPPTTKVQSPPLKSALKSRKPKAPSPPVVTMVCPKSKPFVENTINVEAKSIDWDKKVLENLESQGFTRTESSSRLVYAYNSQEKSKPKPDAISEEPTEPVKPDTPSKRFRTGAVANRAAIFEQKPKDVTPKTEKDPALLSLAARKALFEKNKGDALVPKAPFGMSIPVKVETPMKASETKFIGSKTKETIVERPKSPVAAVYQAGGIASKMAALLENKNKATISEKQIVEKVKEERQKEMDMLLNRFNKNINSDQVESQSDEDQDDEEDVNEETAMLKNQPKVTIQVRKSAEKRKSGSRVSTESSDSHHVVTVLNEVKRIKVSPPKVGRLYPNLSDIEANTRTPTPNHENSSDEDNVCDSDDPNTSFGRDIMKAVCKNITPSKKIIRKHGSSSSENSSVMEELDEILEEMDDDDEYSAGPTPPKMPLIQNKAHASHSFHYKSFNSSISSQPSNFQSPRKSAISPRQSMEMPMVVVEGNEELPLTHTVSFYRRQQNEVHTPVRQVVRQPAIEEEVDPEENNDIQAKMTTLQEEIHMQQNIMAQTSQALNLCTSTPEFSGSTEQVEAERVLLLATHRRQAAVHELQRLKVEGTIKPISEHSQNLPLEKGSITISNIVLPLKQKYVTALAAAGGKGHHVVCLIKSGEQVKPTKLVSTVASSSKNPDFDLRIPDSVTLNNVFNYSTVTFEVYCLQAQEESLPHEVKYHITKKSSKGLVTPKKSKQDSRLVRPPKESPAGPHAVRSSSFALMGYVVFSVQAVNKRVWALNNAPQMSPLEGCVEMKINCELAMSIEYRAFLTMFEDISGFGAWHRRWCLLKGHTLSYWKYPEDEKKMPPIDSIDLTTCSTTKVGPVSREICARLHTFLLERERPAHPHDKNTLVVVRKGDTTVIRHLLSADTKEERIEWCDKLNAALAARRMWGDN